ncbi:MAG: LTA synthase family protein [Bacteroidetes bacterium]|nr:LTA synthase family protein [Bacteroidota bacterium]
MKKRISLFFEYSLFWMIFFIIGRLIFLAYNYPFTGKLTFSEFFLANIYGLRLDLSLTGYIMGIVGLTFVFTSFSKGKILYKILSPFTYIFLFIFSFIIISDCELYRNWGFRMDSTPLLYLRTPSEAIASVNAWMIVMLILFMLIFFLASAWVFHKFFKNKIIQLPANNYISALIFLFISSSMILPIRGGVGIAPINVGMVYFSKTNYANNAAVNVVWNVGYSLANLKSTNKSFNFMDDKKADKTFANLYSENGETKKLINTDKPNVVIIILESFTSKIIGVLGGRPEVTPNFNKLSHEGILFDNFYASGDRSDKGIVAILSGYPAQPTSSIIKSPQKTQNLPYLSRMLAKIDYSTSFYYGGDINFANMRSYFANGGFNTVTKDDFKKSDCNSKWGVHDHIMFNKLLDDIDKENQKFFKVLFTLSSHEPFDVPMKTIINGDDEDNKFLNSAYYTDKCIGKFFDKAQKRDWWKNTIFILVADHGVRLPDNTPINSILKFKIPMLFLGGALTKQDTVIHTYGSQIDIPKTLLTQLGIKNDKYRFSKNLLSKTSPSFAFFSYNNGFGFVSDSLQLVHDNVTNKYTTDIGSTEKNKDTLKACLQVLINDFNNR